MGKYAKNELRLLETLNLDEVGARDLMLLLGPSHDAMLRLSEIILEEWEFCPRFPGHEAMLRDADQLLQSEQELWSVLSKLASIE